MQAAGHTAQAPASSMAHHHSHMPQNDADWAEMMLERRHQMGTSSGKMRCTIQTQQRSKHATFCRADNATLTPVDASAHALGVCCRQCALASK